MRKLWVLAVTTVCGLAVCGYFVVRGDDVGGAPQADPEADRSLFVHCDENGALQGDDDNVLDTATVRVYDMSGALRHEGKGLTA